MFLDMVELVRDNFLLKTATICFLCNFPRDHIFKNILVTFLKCNNGEPGDMSQP